MASLERLLAMIEYRPGHDELWLTGDLVNRGPRSADVLRWARAQGDSVVTVLGNHDLHLLARAAGVSPEKKRDTLDDIMHARDRDELVEWLRTRPLVHVADGFALVHAGFHPRWTIADIGARAAEIEHELRAPSWRAFLAHVPGAAGPWSSRLVSGERWRAILAYFVRVRTCVADGRSDPTFDGAPAQAPAGNLPWFGFPDAAWATHTAIFGHWAALGLDVGPHHLGLDTGCVWGRSLTAMRLPDRAVFQVKAVESAS